jgi:hypothetical protein
VENIWIVFCHQHCRALLALGYNNVMM